MADAEAQIECRICQSSGAVGLLQPCLCKGTVGSVHVRCLEQWLTASGGDRCELCAHQFRTVRVRRLGPFRAAAVWAPANCAALARGAGCLLVLCLWLVSLTYTALIVVACAFNLARIIRGDEFEPVDEDPVFGGPTPTITPDATTTDETEEAGQPSRWSEGFVTLILMFWYLFVSIVFAMCLKIGCLYTCAHFRRKYEEWHRWWNEFSEVRLVLESTKDLVKIDDFLQRDPDGDDFVEADSDENEPKSLDPVVIRIPDEKSEALPASHGA